MTACFCEDSVPNQPFNVRFEKGVNLFTDPRLLVDGEVQYAKNLFPYAPGVLRRRKAMRNWADFSSSSKYMLADMNFLVPPFDDGILAAVSGQGGSPVSGSAKIYLLDESGASRADWGSTVAQAAQTPQLDRRMQMFSYQKKIYILGGAPWSVNALVAYNNAGTYTVEPFAFSGTGNTGLKPRVAGVYRERVVWADLGPGYEDYLVISDPYQPDVIGTDVLAANGRAFRIGSRSGDRIVAVLEISQGGTDNPSHSALLILRQNSAYIMTGEPNLTTDVTPLLGDTEVSRINVQTGCASAETVVRTDYGVLWASTTDVWLLPDQGMPYTVGTKIRPALSRAPVLDAINWHAAFFDGIYRLQIHGEGQGPTGPQDLGYPWVYPQDQWWLDLRGGAPPNWIEAQWWGPMVYTPHINGGASSSITPVGVGPMSADVRPGRVPRLLTIYSAVAGANVPMALVDMNVDDEIDVVDFSLDTLTYGINKPSLTDGLVQTKLTPKNFIADGMEDIRLVAVEERLRVGNSTRITMDVKIDDGRKIDSNSKVVSPDQLAAGTGSLDTDLLNDAFKAISIYPTSAKPGRDLQISLSDSPYQTIGYPLTVDATNNVGYVWEDDSGGNWHAVTLPMGAYADVASLRTAFLTAIAAAYAITDGWMLTVDSPTAGNLEFMTGGGYNIGMLVNSLQGGGFTAGQIAISKAFWNLFGFYTLSEPSLPPASATIDHVDTDTPYALVTAKAAISRLEIGSVQVRINTFGKRP
jgi:hypothetical protein